MILAISQDEIFALLSSQLVNNFMLNEDENICVPTDDQKIIDAVENLASRYLSYVPQSLQPIRQLPIMYCVMRLIFTISKESILTNYFFSSQLHPFAGSRK